jgi:hypothetical protein
MSEQKHNPDNDECSWCGGETKTIPHYHVTTPPKAVSAHTRYDSFIRGALSAGFTDDQVNFLAEWFDLEDVI